MAGHDGSPAEHPQQGCAADHNGGEADAHYVEESGDTGVKLKQALKRLTKHRIVGVILIMAQNLHN
jgi:hypothetical protein